MSKISRPNCIRLRGVRQNNLKNFDLDLPLNKLVVITGLSGSGKSSLAFDTLFAEGQRRYVETFSPYARQFLDRMDKPQVDSIEGIPPAVAIEQKNSVKTSRSTVGTMTEICDYAKLLWSHLSRIHCRNCGLPVRKDTPQQIWENLLSRKEPPSEMLLTFNLPLSEKLSLEESLLLVSRQGYSRVLHDDEIVRIEEMRERVGENRPATLTVVQDRAVISSANRARFIEACEQAYHFGKGRLALHSGSADKRHWLRTALFSRQLHCAECDIEYREPTPAMFSFNHPVGACATCKGFGRVITIDFQQAIPDHSLTLATGAVKPWRTGTGAESQADLLKFCRKRNVPTDVPFGQLPENLQRWVIDGDPDYGKDSAHEWPRAWYGVKGYFRWLESKAYKMHVRVLLSRYRAYIPCPDCQSTRFQPETLLYRIAAPQDTETRLTIANFYQLSVREALQFVTALRPKDRKNPNALNLALDEVRSRLSYLEEVGLGYLTLDRSSRTLSGGETERVNLTACLGSGLVNTLFVLDEPSVGLHPRDIRQLIRILERLRDCGNTVVVVEHERGIIEAADEIIDLGPGHGESGGHLVYQGDFAGILRAHSITGEYLSGRRTTDRSPERNGGLVLHDVSAPWRMRNGAELRLTHASAHNLQNVSVQIPLGRLVCITGVSGSGKTTLMRDVLAPLLKSKLEGKHQTAANGSEQEEEQAGEPEDAEGSPPRATLEGWETLQEFVLVDQSPLGKTPRSNPAVYIGAFDHIRDVFAQTELARQRGLNASAFSFNSAQGQCERCRGAGFEKIEMQFLSDVFIRCPDCDGKRYRAHILEVRVPSTVSHESPGWNIADVLEATVDSAIDFFSRRQSRPAVRVVDALKLLQEVGLGYLRLGQPINTLSGGECQRLKLVSYLAESLGKNDRQTSSTGNILFLFDEPTTGLHFEDINVLLKVFHRLVRAGHSVVVIEHNLDVIQSANWIIDLGPEAGSEGGKVVATGSPQEIAAVRESRTGEALRALLREPPLAAARRGL